MNIPAADQTGPLPGLSARPHESFATSSNGVPNDAAIALMHRESRVLGIGIHVPLSRPIPPADVRDLAAREHAAILADEGERGAWLFYFPLSK